MSIHKGLVLGSVLPPVPEVMTPSYVFTFDQDTKAFVPDVTRVSTVAPLPEDWFLRVAQTDPADIDAITTALNRFGSFGVDRELNLYGHSQDPYLAGRGLSLARSLSAAQRRDVTDARPDAERAARRNRSWCVESRASIDAGIGILKTMLDIWERIDV